ncbi:MAG: transglycosylase SLT domain-containing protein [Alphaproteobacteria bacterium]|nr:transglycosylase SLT domain-containing protein [Alphaproteobacteria bacterium]
MLKISLTLGLCGVFLALSGTTRAEPATSNVAADAVILDMASAFKRGDSKKLSQLLPQMRGHVLEPWAAYWELRARLATASEAEVRQFLSRYQNTYQEDRLRNDWLLLLGNRRDWTTLAEEHIHYRMRDDREVQCYMNLVEFLRQGPKARSELSDETYRLWVTQREGDEGCALAADRLFEARKLSPAQVWRKARLAAEAGRQKPTRQAVEIVQPKSAQALNEIWSRPGRWLGQFAANPRKAPAEMAVLALVRLAMTDPGMADKLLRTIWQPALSAEQRHWVWGLLGKQAAMRLDDDALDHYKKVGHLSDLSEDMLGWMARAALRAGATPAWAQVEAAIRAMPTQARSDSTWVYWLARAELAQHSVGSAAHQSAIAALEGIASTRGFYEQLAMEELGRKISAPSRPEPLTEAELAQARQNPSLKRALYAISIGLRPDGVREWNYGAHLVNAQGQLGRMSDRELLATAAVACEKQVWDRCINTSDRMREITDVEQSFPMPYRDAVIQRSREIALDPAYVYGLIRQESRFIMDARSHVGAAGLMQVMPATAKWTAKKIGLDSFRPEQINQRDVNIAIGTGYLKLVLDNFDGSMPLAAAAYNAGPSRSRRWRQGPDLEAAIWAENVPFHETRDYVKKVLSNTTMYAAVISGQPQSLKARLGRVGPKPMGAADNADIP